MRSGVVASVLLHVAAAGVALVSLPDGLRTTVESEPYIPIEILAKAESAPRTSVPAMGPKPKPVEAPTPPEPKPPEPKPEPKPAPAEAAPKPEPEAAPEPEPTKAPEPEPEKKPEPPKKDPKPEPKKPPSDDLDLDRLSALVDKARKDAPADAGDGAPTLEADRPQEAVGAGDRLAASDIAKMRAAVSRCWNASALVGAPEPERLVVLVEIRLGRDGMLASEPRVLNGAAIALSGNRFWKVAEQNAVRAVVQCQPYDFLDPARYDTWREIELNFDPREMAGF